MTSSQTIPRKRTTAITGASVLPLLLQAFVGSQSSEFGQSVGGTEIIDEIIVSWRSSTGNIILRVKRNKRMDGASSSVADLSPKLEVCTEYLEVKCN